MERATQSAGMHLREWRKRRRMSQLDLACEADISSKHLSFVETGRAVPSRDMVLRLCECLAVPPREQNMVLLAAGYAPFFPMRPIDDPALAAARRAMDLVLAGHEPFPALAVDRHWSLVAANKMVPLFMAGAAPDLLKPPVNVLRLALHPEGLAPRVVNLKEWRDHLLLRLDQQIDLSADAVLTELRDELAAYPVPAGDNRSGQPDYGSFAVPIQVETDAGTLSLFSTTTVFGTPVDVTLSELAIEAFFPTDDSTLEALRRLAGSA